MLLSLSLLSPSIVHARQTSQTANSQSASSQNAVKSTQFPQLSVQLWSVKEDVSKDFEGTLKKLAAMGFQGVEFAGDFGPYKNDAPGLKRFFG